MAYTAHDIQKYEKVAATAATLVEKKLVVPNFFQHQSANDYKGGQTVNGEETYSITVPGVLPSRSYAWRNDRSAPIQFDKYAERKVSVSFGGRPYSAVELTDEQKDFDLGGSFGRLVASQTSAVRRQLEDQAVDALTGAPYEITVNVAGNASVRTLARAARRALNGAGVPDGERILLLGLDWEEAALADDALAIASSVGERRALAALERAVIGELYGLTVVVSGEIEPDAAYAFVRSAFVFVSGVPSVPRSIPVGATASTPSPLGLGLRWMQDYDVKYFVDRSVFDMYAGFNYVDDPVVTVDSSGNGTVSEDNHFIRAVQIVAGADNSATSITVDTDELASFTGFTSTESSSSAG